MPVELTPILTVLAILAVILVAFLREWASADVIAMSGLCALVVTGVLAVDDAYSVFNNPAPITIAAMFILGAALEKTGVIDGMGRMLGRVVSDHLVVTLPALVLVVAAGSAFVNNTPVVAVFLPVVLGICRRKHISASKLLIPLSYAAVLGGTCTLIGTSTNILVSGIATAYNQAPLGMFEFAPLGLTLTAIGTLYMWLFGPWRLPDRLSIASVLSPEERRQFLCHVLIKPSSPLVGRPIQETPLAEQREGFRIIEVRRGGARLTLPLNEVIVKAYDRILVAVSSKNMAKASDGADDLKTEVAQPLGIENLSTIQGAIIEGVVAPHSRLIGKTLRSSRFRQTYGMLVLAIHREGKNLAAQFSDAELEFGDTVLMLGPLSTFAQLREEGDFMLLEEKSPSQSRKFPAAIALTTLATVVIASAFEWAPIVFTSTAACLVVLWSRCLNPREAYESIDWTVIFMLYGMLAVGTAMETTGTASWLAGGLVQFSETWVPPEWRPIVVLSLFYLLGSALTEVLSNNATALVLVPIAINTAVDLGLDPRPFIFAVAFASSAAFTTPIGYQTHMMVYGAGGYRFSDFVKFGLPLNITLWAAATLLIPLFWPFEPAGKLETLNNVPVLEGKPLSEVQPGNAGQ